jgi:hypothetical protein
VLELNSDNRYSAEEHPISYKKCQMDVRVAQSKEPQTPGKAKEVLWARRPEELWNASSLSLYAVFWML